jgi:hypothetical protein
MVVAIAIIVDATTTAAISSLVDVSASFVAKSDLASGPLAAPTVRDVADASAKLL